MKSFSNQPCVLLVNDLHLSKDTIGEFEKNWDEALSICKERGINVIAVGGDLWQSRAGQTLATLMAAKNALCKAATMDIAVILEPGNHDKTDPESIYSYSHIFSPYPQVTVIDSHMSYPVSDGVILWFISYFPENGSFTERLKELQKELDTTKINILYCHEGINGAIATSSDKELAVNVFSSFDKVLVGHYHNRAILDNGRIEYIGSSRQHNFGEDEQKGYTLLYADGTTEFIKNQVNTRYVTIQADVEDIDEHLDEIRDYRANGVKVRLKVNCNQDQVATINRKALMELGVAKIEVSEQGEVARTTSAGFENKFDKNKLKKEYSRFCLKKGYENIEAGLRYLDKITDSCGN